MFILYDQIVEVRLTFLDVRFALVARGEGDENKKKFSILILWKISGFLAFLR